MRHPLDRPIWNALSSAQASLAAGNGRARRFQAEVSPLAAPADMTAASAEALAALVSRGEDIALLEPEPPVAPADIQASIGGVCLQMMATALTSGGERVAIEPLGDGDADAMLALAMLTRPGPFRARTHTLGRFVGVRDGSRLVAMAGERLKLDGFVEISAVCTHPDHRGRGLGAALMRAVGDRILKEGATPFLHSYATNETAVALYRSLGFVTRIEVVHAIWKRAA